MFIRVRPEQKLLRIGPSWRLLTPLAGMCLLGAGCHSVSSYDSSSSVVCEEMPIAAISDGSSAAAHCPRAAHCPGVCDFPHGAIPAPPGTYVRQWEQAHIAGGDQYDFLISRHEWYQGEELLGPEGTRHVRRLVPELQQTSGIVVIESEPIAIKYDESLQDATTRTAQLDEIRRQHVVAMLEQAGVSDASSRVTVEPVARIGVHGAEAPRAYQQLFFGGGRGGGNGGFGGG
ncbi:MAG TPA: hypothetical protein VNQ76_09475, partial [Planctomicrobium sp.]|nr:hypothetical protein [Planctomicrobium sp.]